VNYIARYLLDCYQHCGKTHHTGSHTATQRGVAIQIVRNHRYREDQGEYQYGELPLPGHVSTHTQTQRVRRIPDNEPYEMQPTRLKARRPLSAGVIATSDNVRDCWSSLYIYTRYAISCTQSV